MRFAGRLVLGAVGILLFSILLMSWTFRAALRDRLEDNLALVLERQGRLIQDALPEDPRSWDRLVGRLAAERGHRVSLLDSAGVLLSDNTLAPAQLRNAPALTDDPEVVAARAGQVATARRVEDGTARLVVVVPGTPLVRVSAVMEPVETAVGETQRSLLLAALLALIAGGVLAWFGARSVARPLEELAAATRAVAQGNPPRLPRSPVPEVEGMAHALRDLHHSLTEQSTRAMHGEAQASALIEVMSEGVLAADARGRLLVVNPAARRLLGYDAAAPMTDLLPLFRSRSAREVVEAGLAGQAVENREIEIGDRVALASSSPLPSGGIILVLHDLTELRRLEVVRRDFVANASHELKTPLTSIAGYAETLLEDDTPPAVRRQFVETILANAHRMQALVDDQLDLARIEGGRWHPQPVPLDLAAAIHETWEPRAERAGQAGLRLVVAIDPAAAELTVDPGALRQILGNLIDNAIRHTPPGGTITVAGQPVPEGIALAVRDTGSGIGSEHLPRIFERYYRADPGRARDVGGTGLGLSIVKHLVEAHGGTVAAHSVVGEGTTVQCVFPTESLPD